MIESTFLNVLCGDAILIRFLGTQGKYVNILVDGGYVKTYTTILKPQLLKIKDRSEKIDLLVLTHYDADHIGGIISFMNDLDFDHETFVEKWCTNIDLKLGTRNGEISVSQLLKLKDLLVTFNKLPEQSFTNLSPSMDLNGADIIFLSPNELSYSKAIDYIEDKTKNISAKSDHHIPVEMLLESVESESDQDESISNGSSLAFILKINKKNFLLLGDAHPSVVNKSLELLGYNVSNRLKLNWMKLGHHGSKMNISNSLLESVDCKDFVLSVNGINRSGLPNKETLVRILKNGLRNEGEQFNFYFTHCDAKLIEMFKSDEREVVEHLNFNNIFPAINKELTIKTNN